MELSKKYFESSPYYAHHHVHGNREKGRELEKIYYIYDKREKLKKLQELLLEDDEIFDSEDPIYFFCPYVMPNLEEIKKIGFSSEEEFENIKQRGVFHYQSEYVILRRQLEIECYLMDIVENAPILREDNKEEVIFYYIDQRYKVHENVLSSKAENLLFSEEYHNIITDFLFDKMAEIDKENTKKLSEYNTILPKKIIWKGKKNTLGTLFAYLLENGIIEIEQTKLARAIENTFVSMDKTNPNFSYNSLRDNLQFKSKDEGLRPQYDTELEKHIEPLLNYLTSTIKE